MTGLGLLWNYSGTTVGHRRLICRDSLAGDAALALIRDSIESLSVDSLAGTQKRTALDAISRIEGEVQRQRFPERSAAVTFVPFSGDVSSSLRTKPITEHERSQPSCLYDYQVTTEGFIAGTGLPVERLPSPAGGIVV